VEVGKLLKAIFDCNEMVAETDEGLIYRIETPL
jgi:hypothetical protein